MRVGEVDNMIWGAGLGGHTLFLLGHWSLHKYKRVARSQDEMDVKSVIHLC